MDGKSFLAKLKDGDFGLTTTFWIYFFVVNIIVNITSYSPLKNSGSIKVIWFFGLIVGIYNILVSIGIWNAATNYDGSKIWSILSKIVVVLVVLEFILYLAVWIFGPNMEMPK